MDVLVQIDAWDPSAQAPVTLRAGSRDAPEVCHALDATWWPSIAKLPALRYDFFDGAFGDQITAPSSSLTIQTEPWPKFGGYSLPDARFKLWTRSAAEWVLCFDGRVTEQPEIADGAADIQFAVDDRWLDKALLATYAGTTGAEGPLAMAGQIKPMALGAPRYVPGQLIDSVNSVFQVTSYGPLRAFDAALDRLVRFGPPVANYPTYDALVAATIAPGEWATATTVGMARFGAPPAGKISFLVQGELSQSGAWARRPGQLIRRIATLAGASDKIDSDSLLALDVARPYNLSLYIDAQTTAREIIQRIAASVNAVAVTSWLGKLHVLPVGIGAPTMTLAADGSSMPPVSGVKQIGLASPWQRLSIGAERTWAVHALSEIAFAAELIPMGLFKPETTYREGNIVSLEDGSTWLYIATTPAAGHVPPKDAQPDAAGNVFDAWWFRQAPPTIASSVPWSGVIDDDGNKPDDGATVGAPDGTTVGGVRNPDGSIIGGIPAGQVPVKIEELTTSVSDLVEVYGDTVSAAASADAAQDAAANAGQAFGDAQAARDAARAARDLAQGDAQAASTSATIATEAATDAESSATAASAARDSALSAKGAAESARDSAAQSKTDAAGSASSAAASSGVSASASTVAQLALADTFPAKYNPGAFSLNFGAAPATLSPIPPGWGSADYFQDISLAENTPQVVMRGVVPYEAGKIYRAIALAAGIATTTYWPYCAFWVVFYDKDFNYLAAGGPYAAFQAVPGGATGTMDIKIEQPGGFFGIAGAAWVRVGLLINRRNPELGQVISGAQTRVSKLYLRDVTAEVNASGSATSAATSASAAAASQNDAGQKASAAQQSATAASTSAGNAKTSETNAARSETNAAGSESRASQSAGLAAGSANASGQSATAAAGSASVAATKAGEAGQSATSATQARNDAVAANSTAQTAAGAASNSAAAAGASAAVAMQNATLSARVTAAFLNGNATFSDWPDGQEIPSGYDWTPSSIGATFKVPGKVGRYAMRQMFDAAHGSSAMYLGVAGAPGYGDPRGVDERLRVGPGNYFFEADIELESGQLVGSGMYVAAYTAGGVYIGEVRLDFAREPDSSGAVQGAGVPGRRYRFSKLVPLLDPRTAILRFHPLTAEPVFGAPSQPYKTLIWHLAGIRHANATDEASGRVPQIGAELREAKGALAEVQGRSMAYWEMIAETDGGSPAFIAAKSTKSVPVPLPMTFDRRMAAVTLAGSVLRSTVGGSGAWGQSGATANEAYTGDVTARGIFPEGSLEAFFGLVAGDRTDFNYPSLSFSWHVSINGRASCWINDAVIREYETNPRVWGHALSIRRIGSSIVWFDGEKEISRRDAWLSPETPLRYAAAFGSATGVVAGAGMLRGGSSSSSSVSIGGKEILLYNTSDGSNAKLAMRVANGSAAFAGNVYASGKVILGNGSTGWELAIKPQTFQVSDGAVVTWPDAVTIPHYSISTIGLAPLGSGETYSLYLDSLTSTGGIARLKIIVPGTSQVVQVGPSAATGANPSQVIQKEGRPDASNNLYAFGGSVTASATAYLNNEGGSGNKWAADFEFYVDIYALVNGVWMVVGSWSDSRTVNYGTGGTKSFNTTFNKTVTIPAGVTAFGASGATQISFVQWSAAGAGSSVRSATPNGQTATLTVSP